MKRSTMASAALAAALLGACGIGSGSAEPAGEGTQEMGPYDDQAQMRPELLKVTLSPASPAQTIEVRFPEETERGVAWVLEEQEGDTWHTRWFLTAAAAGYGSGRVPNWQAADDPEEFGWEDVGIGGPGPDTLLIPDEATPGMYRLCTANSRQNICTALEIVN